MSQLDREGLISQSNALFPNNTAQEITPNDIRQFDLDVIDSFALTGSLVVSASHAEFADEAENAEHADAVQFPVIAKETLTKGDPVYVSGYNNGESKPEVLKADASDSSKMPVVGLAMVNASNNDHIFIAVAGNFSNVDTDTGLTTPAIGDTLYVASGGGYTNVKPTGTNLIQNIGVIGRVQQNNGEIVVSAIQRTNDLPNIQNGYLWVGDSSGVPQALATSSIVTDVDTGSLATTGSNVFNGSQTISGSITLKGIHPDGVGTTSSLITLDSDNGRITLYGNQSQDIPFQPIVLTGGGGEDGFTQPSIFGIDTIGANTLSGSRGQVGAVPSGYGVLNANTGSSSTARVYLGHTTPGGGLYKSFESIGASGVTALRGDIITLNPSSSAATSVQIAGNTTFNDELIAKENIEVLNPSGNPYIRIGNTTQQYQFAGMEVYTDRTINPGNNYAGFTVFDTGNSMNGGININTYTGVDGSTPVFQLFGGGGGGGNGQTILAAKDDSTVQFFKHNYFNNTTEFNNNVVGNGPSEFKQKMEVNTSNNPSPGNIFEVNQTGNTTYQVANSTLAGLTGNEIINDMQHGDFVVNNASGSRIKVYEQSRGTAAGRDVEINGSTLIGGANSDVTISAGTSGRTLLLSGSNVTLQSGTPMNINSAVTFNGAMLVNSAIYQGQDDLAFPSASISNQYDYFFVPLTPFVTRVNVDSFLGQGRTVNLLVEQSSGTGLIELQFSGGPTGTTELYGPSAAVTGSFLTPSTTPGSFTSFELKAYNVGGGRPPMIAVTSYEPNLVIGDITKWQ